MKFILIFSFPFFILGCKITAIPAESSDIQETAQQIGDVMASVDEVGGASGNIALKSPQNSIEKTFNRYAPGELEESHKSMIANILQPKANAATCSGAGFAMCAGRVITRNFNNCTVGSATFSGTVTATWGGVNGSGCTLGTVAGDTITRDPNFTVTGRRGATLQVLKSGSIGQRLQWSSGLSTAKRFTFSNDGINRKFTLNSAVLFDQTTTTTTPITITGSDRANRIMNGGVLNVSNAITGVSCDYQPTNVTWTAGCNCPTSGSWAGSCSDGKTTSLVLTSTCGTATYTVGTDTQSITLDRCGI